MTMWMYKAMLELGYDVDIADVDAPINPDTTDEPDDFEYESDAWDN